MEKCHRRRYSIIIRREIFFFADYHGGEILKGQLIGKIIDSEYLEFVYQHLNSDKEIMTGKCKSYPELNEQGKLILNEYWRWTCQDNSTGTSTIIEI